MVEDLVELRSICKTYGSMVAVDDVDLTIARGEFVVLLGPSGSGKTTVLSIMGGFVGPNSGQVLIEGRDITYLPPSRRPTVTVFQDYALFPHMSVSGNVTFGLQMQKVPRRERERRAAEALRKVGLEAMAERGVHQLSGGQKQRVALARALAVEPAVLLLDEPLGALDLKIRQQMQEELVHLQKSLGATFVHVTHDQEEAMSIADKVVVINEGRIEDCGPPERVYLKPATLFAAEFMGESNIFEGSTTTCNGSEVTIDIGIGSLNVPGRYEVGSKVHVSVRPEHIVIGGSEDDGMVSLGEGVVTETVFQGAHRRCHIGAGPGRNVDVVLRVPPTQRLEPGDVVRIHTTPSNIVLLPD